MVGGQRTTGQIVSYLSTLLSIGNIAACTILAWQLRRSTHRSTEDTVRHFASGLTSDVDSPAIAVVWHTGDILTYAHTFQTRDGEAGGHVQHPCRTLPLGVRSLRQWVYLLHY